MVESPFSVLSFGLESVIILAQVDHGETRLLFSNPRAGCSTRRFHPEIDESFQILPSHVPAWSGDWKSIPRCRIARLWAMP